MTTLKVRFRSKKRHASWRVWLGALVFWLFPLSAQALTQCSVTAGDVVFGNYTFSHTTATEAAGNVSVSCSILGLVSLLVSYNIQLSQGSSTSYAPRKMAQGANLLNYNLYTTAGRSTVWGDGTAGSSIVSDGYWLGLLTVVRSYAVYGQIPAGQNVPAGVYSDTTVVTVNY